MYGKELKIFKVQFLLCTSHAKTVTCLHYSTIEVNAIFIYYHATLIYMYFNIILPTL